MTAKTKKSKIDCPRAGKQPLKRGEKTLREIVRLPESIHEAMLSKVKKRAKQGKRPNISAYLRQLVEADVRAKAS